MENEIFKRKRRRSLSRICTAATTVLLFLCALPCVVLGQGAALRMATTTSTDNSGLLDYILPQFKKATGIDVHVIAVGTGKALKLAENGDVDVVLVHAPESEQVFVDQGWGVNRRSLMKNDFVVVGPKGDPAGVKQAKSAADAVNRIKQTGAVFVSRGDDSGTHQKELQLWGSVGGHPVGVGYLEAGQGMEETLRIAHEKRAYTLSDRGTWLAVGPSLDLVILCEKDPLLDNPYSVIAVNPAKYPKIQYMKAMSLIAWLTSPGGQAAIGSFKKQGQVLFHPTAIPEEDKQAR